jgi:hypothetical protein
MFFIATNIFYFCCVAFCIFNFDFFSVMKNLNYSEFHLLDFILYFERYKT